MSQWIRTFAAGACVLIATAGVRAESGIELNLEPADGARRMFVREAGDTSPVTIKVTARSIDHAAHQVSVNLTVTNAGDPNSPQKATITFPLAAGAKEASADATFAVGPGYYQIAATAKDGADTVTAWTDLGVIPPPAKGVRPDSFFQSNADIKAGEDLAFLAAIGLKVERTHFMPLIDVPKGDFRKTLPPGKAAPVDFKKLDEQWAQTKAAGMWVLPLVGYSLQSGSFRGRTELAEQLGNYGPPYDYEQFVATWKLLLEHYPEIKTYEFWNEPWIFGWNFGGTPSDYRRLQKMFCEMAMKVDPHYRLIAGNSTMFVVDNIEPFADCWKGLLAGISHHPYTWDTNFTNFRSGASPRSVDEIVLASKRMELPYAYLTEGGTLYAAPVTGQLAELNAQLAAATAEAKKFTTHEQHQTDEFKAILQKQAAIKKQIDRLPIPENNLPNAQKIVQYYVRAALAGCFAGNAQFGLGFGTGWTQSNTSFAVMTHLLEDRPAVADIWPGNELLWGGVFANPKFATDAVKSLPRAGELFTRWAVPIPADRAGDATKVAVIWSLTGPSNDSPDATGKLTIADAAGLHAYDLFGREIAAADGKLVLPFGASPVYVTTDTLDVIALRDRIATATIEAATPVNLYAFSLAKDATAKQMLSVRVENQLNRPAVGTLHLMLQGGSAETTAPFSIAAGQLAEVAVPWPGATATELNSYAVTLTAELDSGAKVSKQQLVSVARFDRRTIDVNGSLDQWKGVTPVLLDSNTLGKTVDLSQYLLNPHLEKPTGDAAAKRIVARVYTAYDDANVYLAAAVNEDELKCDAGSPTIRGRGTTKVTLPYVSGMPGGLNFPTGTGDVFQFSFGFRDRVPNVGRQMNDPWAWKGVFYDTDYSYVAHQSTAGDQLIRIWGAGGDRRNGYQTEAVPGIEPVSGAKIKISRDESKKLSLYQIAIPRAELSLFNPTAGRCRFGFVLYNNEHLGANGLGWSEAAGVFDHWYTAGSFPPTWISQRPCETFFGIDP